MCFRIKFPQCRFETLSFLQINSNPINAWNSEWIDIFIMYVLVHINKSMYNLFRPVGYFHFIRLKIGPVKK